jgi:eukaryotic-like serine/threonine-protein kinase
VTLAAGTKLGPYEILAPLGAGGMGEVYRARDTRVDRLVALKVLPEEFFEDSERRGRFEREAKLLASLNHPNIAVLYSFEEIASRHLLVMELLDGETLRERLKAGRVPARKAVALAVEMARGLAAAHEKGVVHRDLKPENVFVTHDGHVKILDFGLARQIAPQASDDTRSPTLEKATGPGVVLGTVGYMSPEQVRGFPADHRSDVFSFGCILFEMLSGRRAFTGGSAVETMNAILKEEPPEPAGSAERFPADLERVVRHCLEKNPAERFQSMRDVAFNLEAAGSDSLQTGTARALSAPRSWRALATAAAILAALGGGLWLGARLSRPVVPEFTQITFQRGRVMCARFTPDGQTVVYSAAWEGGPQRLFSTRLGSAASSALDLPPASALLSVSSSGELAVALSHHWTGGWRYAGTLARASIAGGAARDVLELANDADWAPSDGEFAVTRQVGAAFRLEYPIGKTVYETNGNLGTPRFSPRGDQIALLEYPSWGDDDADVIVLEPGRPVRRVSRGWKAAHGLAWSPGGREIWFTATRRDGGASALQAVTLSGKERTVFRGPGRLILHDVARDGRVLLSLVNWTNRIYALAPGETRERDLSWLDWSLARDISQDGRTLLFDESGEGAGAKTGAFVRPTNGGPAVRLGDGEAQSLSPDGRWALVATEGVPSQLVLLPTRAGQSRPVTNDQIHHSFSRFFPDGKRVLFGGREGAGKNEIYVQDVEGGAPRKLNVDVGNLFGGRVIAHDGDRVAVQLASREWAVLRVSDATVTRLSGLEPNEFVQGWTPDDRSVYALRRDVMPFRVFKVDVATGARRLHRELVLPDPAGVEAAQNVLATDDGHSYAYSVNRKLDALFVAEGLK